MLNCTHCDYTTPRFYNLKRHLFLKHNVVVDNNNENNGENENPQNVVINPQNVVIDPQNVVINPQNVVIDPQNVVIDPQNVVIDPETNNGTYQCKDCYKNFTNNYNLHRHEASCKKIKVPLECEYCHLTFATRHSLCVHRKRCRSTSLTIPEQTALGSLISNTIANSTVNSHNTQNNITVNVFPTDINSPFTLHTDHIDIEKLKADLLRQPVNEAIAISLRAVLANRDNLPVRKSDLKSKYSFVHVGNDEWKIRTDKEIYALLSYHVTKCFYFYLCKKNIPRVHRYYQYVTDMLKKLMYGLSNEDSIEMIQRAKHVIHVLIGEAYQNESERRSTVK